MRIKVTRNTRFERVNGLAGLKVGAKRIEATVKRKNGAWVALEVERSGGGGEHGNGRDDRGGDDHRGGRPARRRPRRRPLVTDRPGAATPATRRAAPTRQGPPAARLCQTTGWAVRNIPFGSTLFLTSSRRDQVWASKPFDPSDGRSAKFR